MKKIIAIALILFPFSLVSQWKLERTLTDYIYTFTVLNKDTAFAAGNGSGRIYRTFNGGKNWNFYQTMFEYSWFNDLHFPTKSVGYACGGTAFGQYKQVIAKTTNGGQTWDSLTSNAYGGYEFRGVYFLNQDTGFVTGGNWLYKTTNGGLSFTTDSMDGEIMDIKFTSNQTGFIAMRAYQPNNSTIHSILKSEDKGETWKNVYTETTQTSMGLHYRTLNKISFYDNQHGFVVGNNGIFLKTTDGGNTWVKSLIHPYNSLTAVHFTSPQTGYINNAGGIYKTTDAGNTWIVQHINFPSIIKFIEFVNDTVGFATGDTHIYKTTNAGEIVNVSHILKEQNIGLYPNPARNSLIISSGNNKIESVLLYNSLGKLVKTQYSDFESIDVSNFSNGIYFASIRTNIGIVMKRFVKE